ncbi:glycosyl transferase family protein [Candidatus Magnetomorum sp. HK-1]|nr:glycosyl transferase family protein [Candidatus Magnetomorum sp. HK-1]
MILNPKVIPVTANALIVHSGAIGDVVCSLPGIKHINNKYIFDFCCQKHISPVVRKLPNVRNIFDISHPLISSVFLSKINDQTKKWFSSYTYIVLFSFSKEWKRQFQKYHSNIYRISPRPFKDLSIHVSEFIIDSLINKQLITDDIPMIKELILQKKTKCYKNINLQRLESLAIIHPGSGSSFKNWPFDRFIALAKSLRKKGKTIKWLIGPAENDYIYYLNQNKESEKNILQVDQLEDVINVLDQANYYIGNDSGISHIAALTGVNTIVIFGPSDLRRWAPIGPNVKVIPEKPVCPPCFEIGDRNCTHRNCLNDISVEKVLDIIFEN